MLKKILLWIWQLPQNIIGFILSRTGLKFPDSDVATFYYRKNFFRSAVSLGNYIIIDVCYLEKRKSIMYRTVKHEHGHQLQSKRLGPLYLLVIGIPSLCGNIIDRVFHKKWSSEKRSKWYYSQPWEKWADELGGVERW